MPKKAGFDLREEEKIWSQKNKEDKINHFYYRGIHRTIPCNDLSLPGKRSLPPHPKLCLKPKLQLSALASTKTWPEPKHGLPKKTE